VFVFPSSLEGMPNVVPEAMAVGLPCVVMPFKGLSAELGQPGRDYLLVEHQPLEIAEAVLKLLNDHALYMNFSKNAFNWVKDNLNVKISLSRYAQLYGRLSKS
jgi:glycosyltransferase involved in cell wall biosynthesis